MFNLFKRPIVINFTVESINHDATIVVLKTQERMTREIADLVAKAWKEHNFKCKAIVLDNSVTMEQLNDDDLKRVGLMRISNETTNTQA